ncbi:MAG TPA: THUMP domain-containing protein [Thermoplasmata archaeon]|nr:THUMP domain-containing protein [Thermoplasmata archaeon]
MVLLVRFGEIALKSRYVRRQLRDRLVANIQDLFAAEGVECVTEADEARVYVSVDDPARARRILGRVFGIVSISPATEGHGDLGTLTRLAVDEARSAGLQAGVTFAVRPRRVGSHPFTSQDVAREIGGAILNAVPGAKVNLTAPAVEVHVEVRENRGFVFHEFWDGPGGLPLGSQGRALAVVDGEAGLVAAWMAMKRGCRVVAAAPRGSIDIEALRPWEPGLKVLEFDGRAQLEDLVRLARAGAVFLGTRGRDFDPAQRPKLSVPVFEPVVGLPDAEVRALAQRVRAA